MTLEERAKKLLHDLNVHEGPPYVDYGFTIVEQALPVLEAGIRAAIEERDQEWYDRLRDEGMNFGDPQPSMDKFVFALKGLIVVAGWNNVNEEREACAKVADKIHRKLQSGSGPHVVPWTVAEEIAAAIRARGEK